MDTSQHRFDPDRISLELKDLMLRLRPVIVRHWGDESVAEKKPDNSWVTAVDKLVEAELVKLFKYLLPEAYFLGEETHQKSDGIEKELLKHQLVIIVDPIDGTREYMTGNVEFGSLVGICRRENDRFIPCYGFAYRPIIDNDINSRSRGIFVFSDSTGATQISASVSPAGEYQESSLALPHFTDQPNTALKIVSPSQSARLLPEGATKLASSASIVDLLCPSIGHADAAISKSRFWDIAGPVAIAMALNFPVWSPLDNESIEGFELNDFVQDRAEYKWQLQNPIVIGRRW